MPARGFPAIANIKETISAIEKATIKLLGRELPIRLPTKKPIIVEITLSMWQRLVALRALVIVFIFVFYGHLLV